MKLSDFDNIDSSPFTGVRNLNEPTKVIARDFPDNYFSPHSMIGKTREEFLENIKKWGLTIGKQYEIISIEGFGDVFDVTIKENDFGVQENYMSSFFKDKEE